MVVPSSAPGDRRRVRQFRYMGLQQWRAGSHNWTTTRSHEHVALHLLSGSSRFSTLQASIASVVGSITSVSFVCVFHHQLHAHYIPLVPIQDVAIPQDIFPLYTYIAFFTTVIPPICRYRSKSSLVPGKTRIRAL